MPDIGFALHRISEWYKVNVPSKELILNSGADDDAIRQFETALSLHLPSEVKEMYKLHDGSCERGIFPYGYYLSSLDQVRNDWERWRNGLVRGVFNGMTSNPEGPIRSVWWSEKWIPVTANGSGDHDCVDLDPANGGVIGQVIEFNHETGVRRVVASGIGEWLCAFADALERGRFWYDEQEMSLLPTVD